MSVRARLDSLRAQLEQKMGAVEVTEIQVLFHDAATGAVRPGYRIVVGGAGRVPHGVPLVGGSGDFAGDSAPSATRRTGNEASK